MQDGESDNVNAVDGAVVDEQLSAALPIGVSDQVLTTVADGTLPLTLPDQVLHSTTTDANSLTVPVAVQNVMTQQNGSATLSMSPLFADGLDQLTAEISQDKDEAWQFDLASFAQPECGETIDQDKALPIYHLQQ